MRADAPTYIDRRTGQHCCDPIYAASLLDWCYNAAPGRLLTRAILSRTSTSRLCGWYWRQPWTRRQIAPFAQRLDVDLGELVQPLASFDCLADFIARRIDLQRRPIDRDEATCVAPADGRLLAYERVGADERIAVKGGDLDRAELLADSSLARRFAGGAVVVVRLYLADYHHFHFPAAGTPRAPCPIAGRYYAVTPYARGWRVPFCRDNHRVVTQLESDRFGTLAIVEVGAFTIGSVRQDFVPGQWVAKGTHKGWFEPGASLIVLLFEAGAVDLDRDLCAHTQAGIETRVRMGEAIGRSLR